MRKRQLFSSHGLRLLFILIICLYVFSVIKPCERGSKTSSEPHPFQVKEHIAGSRKVFSLRHMFQNNATSRDSASAWYHVPQQHEVVRETKDGKMELMTLLSLEATPRLVSVTGDQTTRNIASEGPNVTDIGTIVNLAKMTSDAYVTDPSQPGWFNTTFGFNDTGDFGYDHDGLRGHVFVDTTNETVVVAFKGTSIDPRDRARNSDRLNDNLLFSCCCAAQRADPYWYGSVCDCHSDTFSCNSTCLTQELIREERYYPVATAIVKNVTEMYPLAQFWLVGHSLGGALASLIGMKSAFPSISFESPPQKLPAQRLGINATGSRGGFHFGNTADPIYMGACNGYFSSCSVAGYAFESQCHTGYRCAYDTVKDRGWRSSVANHRINSFISDVLLYYNSTPKCEEDMECFDCYNWKFHD